MDENGQHGHDRHDGRGEREPLIPRHGGYRKLKSFQIAQLVYDVTVRFCDRYVDKRSRTQDQMVQAARSGVQNIAEGSQASGTSKKTELKLTNVARASLEELRLDYEDFLRQRRLGVWPRDDPRRKALVARRCATADEVAMWVKEAARNKRQIRQNSQNRQNGGNGRDGRDGQNGQNGQNGQDGRDGLNGRDGQKSLPAPSRPSISSISSISSIQSIYAGISANAALVLIGVTMALLDRQIASQAEAFETEGGFTERLYRVRQDRRRGL